MTNTLLRSRYIYLLLASLIFSCNLFAARLQTNATADTYLYDQTVATASGSFSIRMASTDAMTRMNATATTTNYTTGTTGRLGLFNTVEDRWLMRYATLDDSMRTTATGKTIRWDSARVFVYITGALTAGDYMSVAMVELRSARDFVETEATWTIFKTSNNWTSGGAENTTSDIHTPNLDTSATLTNSSTSMSFKIPGTNITDTLNNVGVILRILENQSNYDGASNQTVTATIASDDYTTDSTKRPLIIVYYSEMNYPDYGGADTLLIKKTNPATTIGHSAMTFDISSIASTADLETCSLFVYVNGDYSVDAGDGSQQIIIGVGMKPLNIGTGTGGATATGKMNWGAWFENGATDSTWGIVGALDQGSVCNRSTGTGDDKTSDLTPAVVRPSGAGWHGIKLDTTGVRTYLNGGCANFGLILEASASVGDDAWWVLSSVEGSNDPYLVINYTPGAATATVGTGRFGRSQTGEYLNVR